VGSVTVGLLFAGVGGVGGQGGAGVGLRHLGGCGERRGAVLPTVVQPSLQLLLLRGGCLDVVLVSRGLLQRAA